MAWKTGTSIHRGSKKAKEEKSVFNVIWKPSKEEEMLDITDLGFDEE